jgi:cyclopropane fatty-acyl-phospholipid synthase-like methyltransferase
MLGPMSLEDLRRFMIREPDVDRVLSPDDSMFEGDEDHYRETGLSALRCVKSALTMAGRTSASRILDLPCGHGRVLRYLRAEFPEAEIVACDLERGGVDFCAEKFGAIPVYSDVDPSKVQLPGKFDLIWCGSLFTHLAPASWIAILKLFDSVLGHGGLMVFTVHGRMSASWMDTGYTFGMNERAPEMVKKFDEERFAYGGYEDQDEYGISLSRVDWVTRLLQDWQGLRLLSYTESGWLRHQDVAVYQRPPRDWTDRPPSGSEF